MGVLFYLDPLVGVLAPSLPPWGSPTSAIPGNDFRAYFIEHKLLGISRISVDFVFHLTRESNVSYLKLFLDATSHLGGVLWGTPASAKPGTEFIAYFTEMILFSIVKLVI